jgi:hypothetical protein
MRVGKVGDGRRSVYVDYEVEIGTTQKRAKTCIHHGNIAI